MDNLQVKLLSDHLSRYPIIFAYIFGSHAKGKSTLLSDIDIAIFINKTITKSERFDIRLRLTNELSALVGKRADLIVMNDIPIQLAYEVIKHGRLILCKDRDMMINTETIILSKYLDRRYYDKRRAELILEQIKRRGLVA